MGSRLIFTRIWAQRSTNRLLHAFGTCLGVNQPSRPWVTLLPILLWNRQTNSYLLSCVVWNTDILSSHFFKLCLYLNSLIIQWCGRRTDLPKYRVLKPIWDINHMVWVLYLTVLLILCAILLLKAWSLPFLNWMDGLMQPYVKYKNKIEKRSFGARFKIEINKV